MTRFLSSSFTSRSVVSLRGAVLPNPSLERAAEQAADEAAMQADAPAQLVWALPNAGMQWHGEVAWP